MAPFQIDGVNDRGSSGGYRWFELYGSFPAADNALRLYRAEASANNAWLNTRVDFESATQINVAVPMVATGALVLFRVGLGGSNQWSNTFGPVAAKDATIEIRGVNDRARDSTGTWNVELYGEFGTDPVNANVKCDGHPVTSRLTYFSRGQVNVAFALPAAGASCELELSRSDNQRTPPIARTFGRAPVPMSPALGGYFWGGMVPPQSLQHEALAEGLSHLAAAGFRAARIRLTPELLRSERNVYNFDLDAFRSQVPAVGPFLGPAVRSAYFQRAFNVPGLQTFVFTAYDAASIGEDGTSDNLYRLDWLATPANAQALVAEYHGLALALCETQCGTGKRFIVANWETDNHIYVDGAYGHAMRVRAGQLPTPSSPSPAERIAGFIRWFQLRKQGIEEGKAEAQARGWTGVRVDDAIEFASYLMLQTVGAPSALFDIIPFVKPAVASYSSWESTGDGLLDRDLPAIQRRLGPHTELILGEFGQEEGLDTEPLLWRFMEAVKAVKRAHVPVVTVWEAFTTIGKPDGLFDWDGAERELLRRLRKADVSPVIDMTGPIAIVGMRDRGDSPVEGRRHFELYGRFPAPGTAKYEAEVRSDAATLPAVVTYQDEHQINVAIDIDLNRKWCVFRVYRTSDRSSSNDFGPRPVGPMAHTQ